MLAAEAKKIINIVLQFISSEDLLTTEIIRITVRDVVQMLSKRNQISDVGNVEEEQLIREIEALCNVYVPAMLSLDDKRDHQEWLSSRRSEINWRFWERYKQYLENDSTMPPQAVRRLDEVTDQLLSRLEYPLRPGSWDRRGMVVGQVQSGKTSNYIALICKAADAGYKLIVVLAGIHNSLRSQTQLRLDEGFLGFDTQQRSLFDPKQRLSLFDPNNSRFGVGFLPGIKLYVVHSLTSSDDKGDFNLKFARQANFMFGGAEPVLLVVKKNASVLKNLLKWSTSKQGNSQSQVHEVPLLLIDDEADNASINTNPVLDEHGNPDPEIDPSKINGLIRRLLNSFQQSAYIGYTATPFANIFIADKVSNEEYGEDLFPRSFIINLQPPSNYLGPAKLFGLIKDPVTGQEVASGLPLIRRIDDYLEWMPDKHKKEHRPSPLPPSVKEAIKAFILTCATRYVRGQEHKHNSMLIHVTRFTSVQSLVAEQVIEELFFIQQRLRYGDGYAPVQIIDELKALWNANFEPTMKKFHGPEFTAVTWEQVKEVLYIVASKIEVRKINGTAKDTLQYVEHSDGLSVICIGGDKLSRGLTLEGLSISYYLRASKMYDTLMQMGRWFGYRVGYADVCRLYTTSELTSWYRDITAADEELREMFEDMVAQDKTPEDYGLGVKEHPDGLLITAAAKMRHGQTLMVSYSHSIVETVVFFGNETRNQQNLLATERLIADTNTRYKQRSGDRVRGNYVWHGIDGEAIVDFLTEYSTHETARKVQSAILIRYIKMRLAENELMEWTIALISNQEKVQKKGLFTTVADLPVGLTERHEITGSSSSDPKYSIRRLVSPSDEWIDFSEEEIEQAKSETQKAWHENRGKSKRETPPEVPSGLAVRRTRPSKRGLLLLYLLDIKFQTDETEQVPPIVGFAISFPKSYSVDDSAIKYMVNNIYWQQEFGGEV